MQKLLTRPWIGILLVVLSSIIAEYFFFKYGFQKGFTSGAISYQVFLAIAIACIITSPLILEKSFITIMTGIFILSLFFIATVLVTILNMGGDWGGSIAFVFVIFVFLYFILWALLGYTQEQSTIENRIHVSHNPQPKTLKTISISQKPIPQQPYIVSDPTKPLQVNVENAIRMFKPSRRYEYEIDYQNELYNWLSREFQVQYEIQTGSSRPDLIIKNIAIEIKGPTRNRELDTLTTKFLKYSNHYPHFIIVLFDCNFTEGHFHEIYNGIRKFAPNVIIIRK